MKYLGELEFLVQEYLSQAGNGVIRILMTIKYSFIINNPALIKIVANFLGANFLNVQHNRKLFKCFDKSFGVNIVAVRTNRQLG